jgi:hypothetical protein
MQDRHMVLHLVNKHACKRVLEIGVWQGALANKVHAACPTVEQFDMVDPWEARYNTLVCDEVQGGVYKCRMGSDHELDANELNAMHANVVKANSARRGYNVVRKTSEDASKMYPDGYFDLIYIDAVHTYACVKQDIHLWLPKVKAGGILCGDDYTSNFPGVIRAVKELFPDGKHSVHNNSRWFHIKQR